MSSSSSGPGAIVLRNPRGVEVRVISYGGVIQSILVPDRDGRVDDVVLGFDDPAEYRKHTTFFGTLVGRYGNRIARGRFVLDGVEYTLATNNGPNHLHGGRIGWNQADWRLDPFEDVRGSGVVLRHDSPDGDEGYPGRVRAEVTYTLTEANELRVEYAATTDKPTLINLTQHSFFNLAGRRASDVLGHVLTIAADRYTPVDNGLIPTGDVAPVEGTPFDFRRPARIGDRIHADDPQIAIGQGYDHNFVLNASSDPTDAGERRAAFVTEPLTGRTLEVRTTEPGVQLYTANGFNGTLAGKGGVRYARHAGFCLETQHFPDSPNRPCFPSTIVRPDRPYRSATVFAFGTA